MQKLRACSHIFVISEGCVERSSCSSLVNLSALKRIRISNLVWRVIVWREITYKKYCFSLYMTLSYEGIWYDETKKRGPYAKHILRPAKASLIICYQISPKMSIMWPCFVIKSIFLICLCLRIWLTRKVRILLSLIFLIREESIMILGDCLSAFLRVCSCVS